MDSTLGRIIATLLTLIALAGVAYAGYQGYQAYSVGNQISAVQQIAQGVKGLYGGSPNYATLTNTVVVDANIVPSSMNNGGTIQDTWGGTVNIGPDATYSNAFDITLAAVPQEACVKLATGMASSDVSINGGANIASPVDPGTAAAQCAAGNGNSILFVFE